LRKGKERPRRKLSYLIYLISGVFVQTSSKQFESLLRENYQPIYNFCIRTTKGSSQDADDLFQRSCLRAWVNFEKFQDGTNFKAWFKVICYNAFITEYHRGRREQRRCKRIESLKVESCLPYLFPSPERALQFSEGYSKEVLDAIDKMSHSYRDALLLRADDLSYKEIAEELKIPIGTVMSRLLRAREEGAFYLKDYYESFKRYEVAC
jgi:RNA polymerase sigma-70 factor, ECF subfamily